MDGIIVLDKPQDFTSFDAVAVVRGLTREPEPFLGAGSMPRRR